MEALGPDRFLVQPPDLGQQDPKAGQTSQRPVPSPSSCSFSEGGGCSFLLEELAVPPLHSGDPALTSRYHPLRALRELGGHAGGRRELLSKARTLPATAAASRPQRREPGPHLFHLSPPGRPPGIGEAGCQSALGGSPPRGGSEMPGSATGSGGGGGHGADTRLPAGARRGRAGGRAAEPPPEPRAGRAGPQTRHGARDAGGGGGAQRAPHLQAARPLQRPQDVPQPAAGAGQALRQTLSARAVARAAVPAAAAAAAAALRLARRRAHQQQRAAAVPDAAVLPGRVRPGPRRRRRLLVVAVLHTRRAPGPPEDSGATAAAAAAAAPRGPRRLVVVVLRRRRQVRPWPGERRGQQRRG
ncbi:BEN domain-containing protein 4 isoform X3 [Rattus norvegicus]|uniref:BEN domain-containing protein 4 isoform X3 n=1 Tax=Rattus norvegicus TaxID=10116 RepID=UPI002FD80623